MRKSKIHIIVRMKPFDILVSNKANAPFKKVY